MSDQSSRALRYTISLSSVIPAEREIAEALQRTPQGRLRRAVVIEALQRGLRGALHKYSQEVTQ